MHKKGKFSSLDEEKSCPKRTIYLSPLLLTKVQKYMFFKACRAQKRAIPFIKIQAAVIPIRQFGQEQTHKNIPISVHSRCHFHVRDERKSKGQHPGASLRFTYLRVMRFTPSQSSPSLGGSTRDYRVYALSPLEQCIL